MHLTAARSVPEGKVTITRREANLESDYDENTVSEITQLQTELANLSIPSYLKQLYINLTYPNEEAHLSSNLEGPKVNTIVSYKNKATSKLLVYKI